MSDFPSSISSLTRVSQDRTAVKEGISYVNCRSCCSSYFNFASSCRIVLPSFCLDSLSSLAKIARWTSSIAPVLRCQHVLTPPRAVLTTIIGQRSRAEIKAKDVRSEVAYGATMSTMYSNRGMYAILGQWFWGRVFASTLFWG